MNSLDAPAENASSGELGRRLLLAVVCGMALAIAVIFSPAAGLVDLRAKPMHTASAAP